MKQSFRTNKPKTEEQKITGTSNKQTKGKLCDGCCQAEKNLAERRRSDLKIVNQVYYFEIKQEILLTVHHYSWFELVAISPLVTNNHLTWQNISSLDSKRVTGMSG
ncbi:CLUMA_CG012925, isoform A [Clunio marinus]|uniref:CLUMA_CG012925, isoform A n=1 Tax=Clunio marinus TaxID=568069 RepID=A0A1J1IH87_9DIPT|nr:CLUMA_CG012925, isoform A [Clunio marinus]